MIDEDFIRRFWEKVEKAGPDDCWLWKGAPSSGGKSGYHNKYGVIKLSKSRKLIRSNRAVLLISVGEPPEPGMYACHRCDNSLCCNPKHLYWGTHQQNTEDYKDRILPKLKKNETGGWSRHTDEEVRKMHRKDKTGTPEWLA